MTTITSPIRLIHRLHRNSTTQSWKQQHRRLMTLAIETSCDDTAVAILAERSRVQEPKSFSRDAHLPATQARLLFNEKITARNTGLGGIHPIEALECHEANLARLISKAVDALPDIAPEDLSLTPAKTVVFPDGRHKQMPDFISVTRGPGMRSNLACGLNTAKGLAVSWQIPLLGVHHMQAHALTSRLQSALDSHTETDHPNASQLVLPRFPFLTLLVSGGHSMLLHSKGLTDHKVLATTRDIAIGDALDKCGRIILPDEMRSQARDTAFARYLSDYAFPDLDSFATWPVPQTRQDEIIKPGNAYGWQIKSPLSDTKELAFSFTSISSSVERHFKQRMEDSHGRMSDEERLLFARSALGIAFEHLASRTTIALQSLREAKEEISTLVVSGGVAANSFLRHFLRQMLDVRGFQHINLLFPPPQLCTDNAAMIAWAGIEMFRAGFRSELDIGAIRKWSMDPAADDGGILGVGGWRRVEQK